MQQPKELTIVKVVKQSPLVSTVYAVDKKSNVWKRSEGFGDQKWELYRKA
jgi:hypothetical protein